jgi:hypothetical protein
MDQLDHKTENPFPSLSVAVFILGPARSKVLASIDKSSLKDATQVHLSIIEYTYCITQANNSLTMFNGVCNNSGDSNILVRTQFGDVTFKRNDGLQQNEQLIAHALGQLSLQEREKVFHDVHGVALEIPEGQEFVARKLHETREALIKLKNSSKPHDNPSTEALKLAENLCPDYVNSDQKFFLAFLRADRFDPNKAAGRMARYLDWKLSLFGESKLCKDITLADLQEDEMTMLKKGNFQFLPERDSSGRAVLVILVKDQTSPNVKAYVSIIMSRMI